MRKCDLKTGMIIELEGDSEKYLVFRSASPTACGRTDYLVSLSENQAWSSHLNIFDETSLLETEVSKVWQKDFPFHMGDLMFKNMKCIWDRKEHLIEMTVAQIEEALGYKIKIIN